MLRLGCAPELMRLRLFPDAKELTETFAVHQAVRSRLGASYPKTDEGVTLVAVGDGNTPRTAALFAFLTRWHCVSIDPEIVPWREWRARKLVAGPSSSAVEDEDEDDGDDGNWGGIRRLSAFRRKMQEVTVDCDRAVLVLVHAHVSLADCLAGVRTRTGECAAVIMPCCNWYARCDIRTENAADGESDDPAVVSPHREVRVFETLPCRVSERFGARERIASGGVRRVRRVNAGGFSSRRVARVLTSEYDESHAKEETFVRHRTIIEPRWRERTAWRR